MNIETISRSRIGNELVTVVKVTTPIYTANVNNIFRNAVAIRNAWLADKDVELDNCNLGLVYADLSALLEILSGQCNYFIERLVEEERE